MESCDSDDNTAGGAIKAWLMAVYPGYPLGFADCESWNASLAIGQCTSKINQNGVNCFLLIISL